MGVELAQKERERVWEQLLTLLVKSRIGKSIDVIVEKIKKFVSGSIALHGDKETNEFLEIKFS